MQASSTERLGYDATATARNVSRIASRVDATLATAFFACLVQARPQRPRDNEKRGPQSEASHTSVWLRFGAATWPGDGASRAHASIVI